MSSRGQTAAIIAVGTELLSGQSVDTNSAYLAKQLQRYGFNVRFHCTIDDDRQAIAEAIQSAAARVDLVIVTGGLGPTADDLTRQGLADAMGSELRLDEVSLEQIEAFFRLRGRNLKDIHRIQAMLPAGGEALPNRLGTAPGIAAKVGGAGVFVLPGVPSEMQAMFAESVLPRLKRPKGVILQHVLRTFGEGESHVAEIIADLMSREANPQVGITAAAGIISVRLSTRGEDKSEAERLAADVLAELQRRLGGLVFAAGDAELAPKGLASVVGEMLGRGGWTLATAESCTGGLLGELITDVPGASEYYLGGIVAYDNRVKVSALGVPGSLIDAHGAVSEPVAQAMADGCRRKLSSDWAAAVTGIAGPAGGSDKDGKPVGLVYIAVAGRAGCRVHRHVFPGTREIIRRRAALSALNHLRVALANEKR